MLSRCESLEPPMSQMGQPRRVALGVAVVDYAVQQNCSIR